MLILRRDAGLLLLLVLAAQILRCCQPRGADVRVAKFAFPGGTKSPSFEGRVVKTTVGCVRAEPRRGFVANDQPGGLEVF